MAEAKSDPKSILSKLKIPLLVLGGIWKAADIVGRFDAIRQHLPDLLKTISQSWFGTLIFAVGTALAFYFWYDSKRTEVDHLRGWQAKGVWLWQRHKLIVVLLTFLVVVVLGAVALDILVPKHGANLPRLVAEATPQATSQAGSPPANSAPANPVQELPHKEKTPKKDRSTKPHSGRRRLSRKIGAAANIRFAI